MSNASQAASAGSVVLEMKGEGVARVMINRPDRLNALNNELAAALNDALEQLAQNDSIRVVILTGAGRAFCAGGDLGHIRKGRESGDIRQLEPLLRAGMQMVLRMRTMPQPVIVAVNGAAAGAGMNIALGGDIRICSEDAVFGQNFVKIGLFPDYGGTFLLPELAGPAAAAEMFYTGDMVDAKEALRMGIVNRVARAARLEQEAEALARKIAQGPTLAIQGMKQTLFAAKRKALEEALENEVRRQMQCFLSEDCGEGIRAFFEKRAPKFEGR